MMPAGALDFAALFAAPLAARGPGPASRRARAAMDDAELVRLAQGGDPHALPVLYQRHAGPIYARLTHLVGPDPEREDLLQEVFAAAFRGLPRFRHDASFRTYLYRIASNKACDHLRRRARAGARRGGEPAGACEPPCPDGTPEERLAARQRAARLLACLDRIKPKKRVAFVLRVAEGLSLKEIAEQVGASVPAVAQRIRHARMELCAMMNEADRG